MARRIALNGALIAILSCLILSCMKGPGVLKQNGSVGDTTLANLTNQDGVVSGEYRAGAGTYQSITSTDLGGAGVTFAPGSLATSTTISVQKGADIATSLNASEAGISTGGLTASGSAVVISSSVAMDASSPFSVSIPVSSTALSFADNFLGLGDPYENFIVFYKIRKNSDSKNYLGFILRDDIRIENGLVKFTASNFGSFQFAYTNTKQTQARQSETKTEILTSKANANLAPIVWSVGTPQMNAAATEAVIRLKASGFQELIKCSMFLYEDKTKPPAVVRTKDNFANLSFFDDDVHVEGLSGKTSQYQVYVRFGCIEKAARDNSTDFIGPLTFSGSGSGSGANLPNVTGLMATPFSTHRIKIDWMPPASVSGLQAIVVTWVQGNTLGSGSCYSPNKQDLPINGMIPNHFDITGLATNSNYVISVCTKDFNGNLSQNAPQITSYTKPSSFTCPSGSLDDPANPCILTSAVTLTAPALISGTGKLQFNTNGAVAMDIYGAPLIIDMLDNITMNATGTSINGNSQIYAKDLTMVSGANITATSTAVIAYGFQQSDVTNCQATSGAAGDAGGGGGGHYAAGGDGARGTGTAYAGGRIVAGVDTNRPTTKGCGGNSSFSANGGHGGGSIEMHLTGTLNLPTGSLIDANGAPGVNGSGSGGGGGGGAGGSIWIQAANYSTTSITLFADGGAGGNGYVSPANYAGGGGAGGIILIEGLDHSPPVGSPPNCSVNGGSPGSTNNSNATGNIAGFKTGC